jgi:GT2 family glycosyltransferase
MINILVLNWNSSRDVESLILSIIKSTYKSYRLILIDNNSQADEITKLTQIYEEYKGHIKISILLNNKNYGYAEGNNKGYQFVCKNNFDGDIMIVNPDIKILPNTINEMHKLLINDVGAVMVRTKDINSTILYDYLRLNGLFQKWFITDSGVIETDYIAGSCVLLKREVVDSISLFDKDFFMYWEEVDLSFRIKSAGYKLLSTTNTSVTRRKNSKVRSSNAMRYLSRNSCLIYLKNEQINLMHVCLYLFTLFLKSIYYSCKERDVSFIVNTSLGISSGIKRIVKTKFLNGDISDKYYG